MEFLSYTKLSVLSPCFHCLLIGFLSFHKTKPNMVCLLRGEAYLEGTEHQHSIVRFQSLRFGNCFPSDQLWR